MTTPSSNRWDYEIRGLACIALCVSIFSFLAFFRRSEILLYGDAVAHINIARRVFDSKTPGLLQLGTVWLPLPHLLMIPFLLSQKMWQEGTGGSIPSMVAYVFGVIGIFRLVRGSLSTPEKSSSAARIAAWIAALIFAANPNLIYMQTTAMGESLYLAFFLWAAVYFGEALRNRKNALTKCGLCLAAASLTRYDGWFLSMAVVAALAVIVFAGFLGSGESSSRVEFAFSRVQLVKFILIVAAAPALWLAYNAVVYHNALEFENGPYSAQAIEKRTQAPGSPGHPGTGNLYVSGLYFLKSAEFNLAENQWLQRMWLLVGLAAIAVPIYRSINHRADAQGVVTEKSTKTSANKKRAAAFMSAQSWWPLVLLLIPLPFYALSVAYGGVPIFIPAWWPFTHYNVRYGLQLLPAFAVSAGLLLYFGWTSTMWRGLLRRVALLAVLALVFASYVTIWQAGPICLSEAQINMRGRNTLETRLAVWLKSLPPDSTLLMYLGDHVGAVERAGIPLRRVINEGNHRVWMRPEDPEGLWERTLADPAAYADYALAFEGDRVWQAVQPKHFKEIVEINVTGQARAILYRTR